jgi:protein ImuB
MGFADARAVCPTLLSRPAEPKRDAAALRRLTLWCLRYGPFLNVDGGDGLWIDTTGVAHLFGGELPLLENLRRRFEAEGLSAHMGLADGLVAARAVAYFSPAEELRDRIVPPGGAREALADLPVRSLGLSSDADRLLDRLGLKRVGQLYGIPRPALERRFQDKNAAGMVLVHLDQALGLRAEPLEPLLPSPSHEVRTSFPEPLISPEGLSTALAGLMSELCDNLERSGLGVRRLVLTLHRSDGGRAMVCIGLSRASRDEAHMLKLLSEKLAGIDAGFGIDVMVLAVRANEPLKPVQPGLAERARRRADDGLGDFAFDRMGEEEGADLARLIDRLSNRLGAARVCRLEEGESHVPDLAQSLRPASETFCPASQTRAWSRLRPVLLLSEPEPISVIAAIPEGPPMRFRWRKLSRRVVHFAGPERIEPEWWREIGARTESSPGRPRDYFRIEDENGRRYWVYRDGLYGASDGASTRWYLQGMFG